MGRRQPRRLQERQAHRLPAVSRIAAPSAPANGKPAIIQHTGPSRILPDGAGMFRFRDLPEAVRSVEQVVADYPWQCQLARTLAEENFDGRKVVRGVLERALS